MEPPYTGTYPEISISEIDERLRFVEELGKSGDTRAVRPLVELLADRDPVLRCAAVTALGRLRCGRPVNHLLERLRDRNESGEIRMLAAGALTAIRSTGALRGLRAFAANPEEDPVIRSRVMELLGHIRSL